MPTYSYICAACQHDWEVDQKINDEPIRVCPYCAEAEAKRQIGRTTFLLQGNGWYSDGYSRKG